MRMVHGTVKKSLLTIIKYSETTCAKVVGAYDRTEVVSSGGNMEISATDGYGYGRACLAWDYHLHVNQLATPTVSPTCVLVHWPLFGIGAEPGILL